MKNNLLNGPSEDAIQAAYFDIVRINESRYPDLKFMFAVPNGGKRHISVAMMLKKTGVRRGPLDIWLPCRRGTYVGLAFEFKRPGKKMTPEQLEYADYLLTQGWYVDTQFDAEQAWAMTKRYLEFK